MNFPSVNNALTIHDEINISVKTWKRIVSVVKSVPKTKIWTVRKTKKSRLFLSICAICGKKNWLLLKSKNSKILIIFQMISLKWIKSWTKF